MDSSQRLRGIEPVSNALQWLLQWLTRSFVRDQQTPPQLVVDVQGTTAAISLDQHDAVMEEKIVQLQHQHEQEKQKILKQQSQLRASLDDRHQTKLKCVNEAAEAQKHQLSPRPPNVPSRRRSF